MSSLGCPWYPPKKDTTVSWRIYFDPNRDLSHGPMCNYNGYLGALFAVLKRKLAGSYQSIERGREGGGR